MDNQGINMERTVFIKSEFSPVGERKHPDRKESVDLWSGKSKISKEEMSYEKEVTFSDRIVNGEYLAKEIERVTNDLALDGYKVMSIIPISSGSYSVASHLIGPKSSYYGFSYTSGILIHASKD
jgi:hypothetical protein